MPQYRRVPVGDVKTGDRIFKPAAFMSWRTDVDGWVYPMQLDFTGRTWNVLSNDDRNLVAEADGDVKEARHDRFPYGDIMIEVVG